MRNRIALRTPKHTVADRSLRSLRAPAYRASVSGTLSGSGLTVDRLAQLAFDPRSELRLDRTARKEIRRGRKVVDEKVASEEAAYGINTGFGLLNRVKIPLKDLGALQVNILMSHATGYGPPLPFDEVRVMQILRLQSSANCHVGMSEPTIDQQLRYFNAGIVPVVPSYGTVGASGDLGPLAHLALPLIGRGQVQVRREKGLGKPVTASKALRELHLEPITLQPLDGLALINGTQFMTALGALACHRTKNLLKSADIIATMSLESLMGFSPAFSPEIQRIRPHAGQKAVAGNIRKLLRGSTMMKSPHERGGDVQDAYSLRCMPQVHGPKRDALTSVRRIIETEMNSVTTNPTIFPDNPPNRRVISGGNFHGQPIAQACDILKLSLVDLISISHQRIERLVNPVKSRGLPAFLVHKPGLNSGFMIWQYAAAAAVAHGRSLAFPSSTDSVSTSGDLEDHVSMGGTSAYNLMLVMGHLEQVLATELCCAAQALDFRKPLRPGKGLSAGLDAFRRKVPFLERDSDFEPSGALTHARDFIVGGHFVRTVEGALGESLN